MRKYKVRVTVSGDKPGSSSASFVSIVLANHPFDVTKRISDLLDTMQPVEDPDNAES